MAQPRYSWPRPNLFTQQDQPPVQGPPGLNHAVSISAVIFDFGNVLYDWDPRFLYERLIDDEQALDTFLRDVVTPEWHFQHDAGRPFAETSAELAARYPQHARSEEHTSELQSLMRISYAVFCLKKKNKINNTHQHQTPQIT